MLYNTPRLPNAGGRITAEFGRNVIRAVRSAMPVASPGMLISRGTYGTSMVPIAQSRVQRVTMGATTVLEPFTLRWFSKATEQDSDAGEWQIYLPMGCATLAQRYKSVGTITVPYIPKNAKATDADGNVIPSWYVVPTPDDSTARGSYAVEGGTRRWWYVHIYLKPWARMVIATDNSANAAYAWDEIVAVMYKTTYNASEGGETPAPSRSGEKRYDGDQMRKEWDASGDFAIRYDFDEGDETDPDATPKVYITNQMRMLGRLEKIAAEDTEITSWTGNQTVWVKVQHSSTAFVMTVEHQLTEEDATSDDDETVWEIYNLKNLVVMNDYRANAPLTNTLFYTSPASQQSAASQS